MMRQLAWTSRSFNFDLPIGWFPAVVERLRGTPVRAGALVRDVSEERLGLPPGEGWSVKEHIGHLDDLDALDGRRLEEYLARATVLSAADMTNRATAEAGHRDAPIADTLERFRRNRAALVERLEGLTEDEIGITALHPRLQRDMRLIDWAYFVAEHDDHHLAHVRAILREAPDPPRED